MFDPRTQLTSFDMRLGKILTASALFRGENISSGEVEASLKKLSDKNAAGFVEWIPNRIMTSVCKVSPPYKTSECSGTMMYNSTAIASNMEKIIGHFDKMYRKRAFVHWYTEEGIDLMEFDEARSNLADLINEYK